jgi:glycosyltransferase involved in cell wall biosynthesis
LSHSKKKLAIVGNFNTKDRYNQYLTKLRGNDPRIILLDPIYDREVLGTIRKNCYAYIHAYEVGGTNPSILEQMLFGKPIIVYDVSFHREVLKDGGLYFKDEDDLVRCIERLENGEVDSLKIAELQSRRIKEEYNWDNVAEKYRSQFSKLLEVSTD